MHAKFIISDDLDIVFTVSLKKSMNRIRPFRFGHRTHNINHWASNLKSRQEKRDAWRIRHEELAADTVFRI